MLACSSYSPAGGDGSSATRPRRGGGTPRWAASMAASSTNAYRNGLTSGPSASRIWKRIGIGGALSSGHERERSFTSAGGKWMRRPRAFPKGHKHAPSASAHQFGAAEGNDVIMAERSPPATGKPASVDLRSGAWRGGEGEREAGSSLAGPAGGLLDGARARALHPHSPPSPTHIGPVGRALVH